jgi:hypothetical protein
MNTYDSDLLYDITKLLRSLTIVQPPPPPGSPGQSVMRVIPASPAKTRYP